MRNQNLNKCILSVALLWFAVVSYGQIKISGTVTGKSSEPLIGASISESGTNSGTITDLDGNFTLMVSKVPYTIIVSYIGYKTITVVNSQTDGLILNLEEDAVGLSEVTVTALGIKREKK